MSIRGFLNDNPKAAVGAMVASLIILLSVAARILPVRTHEVNDYKKQWFYDLESKRLFTADSDKVKPRLEGSEGLKGIVRAHVLSYVYEPNEAERFIGFLEVPDPGDSTGTTTNSGEQPGAAERWGRGKLIQLPGDARWLAADSEQGRKLLREVFHPDKNGETPTYVRPR